MGRQNNEPGKRDRMVEPDLPAAPQVFRKDLPPGTEDIGLQEVYFS